MKAKTVVHWNDIEVGQLSGCHKFKILEKYLRGEISHSILFEVHPGENSSPDPFICTRIRTPDTKTEGKG